jgi:hypothetical protein
MHAGKSLLGLMTFLRFGLIWLVSGVSKRDPKLPVEIGPGPPNCFWWVCNDGYELSTLPNAGEVCPVCPGCTGHKVEVSAEDLMATHLEMEESWDKIVNCGLPPQNYRSGSNMKMWTLSVVVADLGYFRKHVIQKAVSCTRR